MEALESLQVISATWYSKIMCTYSMFRYKSSNVLKQQDLVVNLVDKVAILISPATLAQQVQSLFVTGSKKAQSSFVRSPPHSREVLKLERRLQQVRQAVCTGNV